VLEIFVEYDDRVADKQMGEMGGKQVVHSTFN
jgi:hypothetical protein